jgi:acetyl-CoA carboxylase beta subunit
MGWFTRIKEGITTSTREKKEAPDGMWIKCPGCKTTLTQIELKGNLHVCTHCNFHHRIGSTDYFEFLFDEKEDEVQILFDKIDCLAANTILGIHSAISTSLQTTASITGCQMDLSQ